MKKKIFLSLMALSAIPLTTLVAAACDNNDSKKTQPGDGMTKPGEGMMTDPNKQGNGMNDMNKTPGNGIGDGMTNPGGGMNDMNKTPNNMGSNEGGSNKENHTDQGMPKPGSEMTPKLEDNNSQSEDMSKENEQSKQAPENNMNSQNNQNDNSAEKMENGNKNPMQNQDNAKQGGENSEQPNTMDMNEKTENGTQQPKKDMNQEGGGTGNGSQQPGGSTKNNNPNSNMDGNKTPGMSKPKGPKKPGKPKKEKENQQSGKMGKKDAEPQKGMIEDEEINKVKSMIENSKIKFEGQLSPTGKKTGEKFKKDKVTLPKIDGWTLDVTGWKSVRNKDKKSTIIVQIKVTNKDNNEKWFYLLKEFKPTREASEKVVVLDLDEYLSKLTNLYEKFNKV
ncbi:hypothetical protein [Mycoplasma phocoeninasale]|uniref:hypothetical protein n=1 Tax=Mycoplasma phocoeninasale TaxID=2726117 RepID=UPI001966F40D|nr:hypothetical protein [Mycoplasma phocoeninasale]MBN0970959.1 hypothetical protein [Mycoplasma phocoeninasale]